MYSIWTDDITGWLFVRFSEVKVTASKPSKFPRVSDQTPNRQAFTSWQCQINSTFHLSSIIVICIHILRLPHISIYVIHILTHEYAYYVL